jgi:hypothetical protein
MGNARALSKRRIISTALSPNVPAMGAFEFPRTVSRPIEMQTERGLHRQPPAAVMRQVRAAGRRDRRSPPAEPPAAGPLTRVPPVLSGRDQASPTPTMAIPHPVKQSRRKSENAKLGDARICRRKPLSNPKSPTRTGASDVAPGPPLFVPGIHTSLSALDLSRNLPSPPA